MAVPFYGRVVPAEQAPHIQAALLIHFAEEDLRVNAMQDDYKNVLEADGKNFVLCACPGVRHGFLNNSTPRYNAEQAKPVWKRTLEFLKNLML